MNAAAATTTARSVYVSPAKLATDLSRIFEMDISVNTLAKWRCSARGPAFVKVGRQVRYSVRDVEQWVDGQRRHGEDE